ncbi:hypothetical protein U0070_016199 [Myodes glareolus]|uniref:Uncharacterized protein n=1 Tax=Myodes glareolus TaxID=447135 RepID=A0AAW0HIU7_MYOGA
MTLKRLFTKGFPIAYSIVVHCKIEMLDRLQNFYCIHVNRKAERVLFSRENENIQKVMEWAQDTYSPDEYLWATIQRIPQAISSVSKDVPYPLCSGVHVSSLCVFGAGDLSWIFRKHQFFASKFDTDVDPFAIQCLDEHLRHKALETLEH